MSEEKLKLKVEFFKTSNGKEPVKEWLNEFSKDDKLEIGSDIKAVQKGYPLVGMPLVESLGRGLYQVRSHISQKRITRIIFYVENGKMILLHGFIKKTRKTPQNELDLAYKRYKELRGNE